MVSNFLTIIFWYPYTTLLSCYILKSILFSFPLIVFFPFWTPLNINIELGDKTFLELPGPGGVFLWWTFSICLSILISDLNNSWQMGHSISFKTSINGESSKISLFVVSVKQKKSYETTNVLKSGTLLSATPERHSQNKERKRSATPFYQKERYGSGTPFFGGERK